MMKAVSKASEALDALAEIRANSGNMDTIGLNDETVAKFCHSDEKLFQAIMEGLDNHRALRKSLGTDIMLTDEPELVAQLQEDYVNFYAPATVNPYIALAARGRGSLPHMVLLSTIMEAMECSEQAMGHQA